MFATWTMLYTKQSAWRNKIQEEIVLLPAALGLTRALVSSLFQISDTGADYWRFSFNCIWVYRCKFHSPAGVSRPLKFTLMALIIVTCDRPEKNTI